MLNKEDLQQLSERDLLNDKVVIISKLSLYQVLYLIGDESVFEAGGA